MGMEKGEPVSFVYETLAAIGVVEKGTGLDVAEEASSSSHGNVARAVYGDDTMSLIFRRVIDDDDDGDDSDMAGPSISESNGEIEFMSFKSLEENTEDLRTPVRENTSIQPAFLDRVIPPWSRRGDKPDNWIRSPLLQLHQEIVDFCDFVSPTNEEQNVRMIAIERVTNVIKSIWPQAEVKVFGSFETGLYLPTSDIDMVILHSSCENAQIRLKVLAKALSKSLTGKKLQVIAKARVPIVKFVENESSISFDISFDMENGPQAAEFIKEAMTALPPLKPLCLILKIFLQQRELNEVYTGGLGSYMLLVMLLAHLQMHPSRRSYSSSGESSALERNLGILLVDFFDLYGRALNVKEVGVSCRGGGGFFRKKPRGFWDFNRSYFLAVEDPQTPDNDIGKNSFNIQKVRTAFLTAHRVLTTINSDNIPTEAGLLARIVRLDEKLIGRKMPFSSLRPINYLIPLTSSGNQQDFRKLKGNEQEMSQTVAESDFPREFLKDEDGLQRGVKRKRDQIEKKKARPEKIGRQKYFENGMHTKRRINERDKSPLKSSGNQGSRLKMHLKGNYKKRKEVASRTETQHLAFQGKKRWYDDSEQRFQYSKKKYRMEAKTVNRHKHIGMRTIENMECQLDSTARRVITSSGHKKIKYI